MNAKNIINAFNTELKSFNTAIRFIYEAAKWDNKAIAAIPAKDDKSTEAKQLRKEIKTATDYNNVISDCKSIVATFNITANDIKGKGLKALRDKVMSHIVNVDTNGKAVKFVKLPSYLKSEIKDYNDIFAVAESSWVETIITAAENCKEKSDTETKNTYELSVYPTASEGKLDRGVSGDFVNIAGLKIDSDTFANIWENAAVNRNIANSYANTEREKKLAELNNIKSK